MPKIKEPLFSNQTQPNYQCHHTGIQTFQYVFHVRLYHISFRDKGQTFPYKEDSLQPLSNTISWNQQLIPDKFHSG